MKNTPNQRRQNPPLMKFNLKIKLTTLFLITILFGLRASESYAQKTRISISVENTSVQDIIDNIEATTEFRFIYKTKHVDLKRRQSVTIENEGIEKVLEILFENTYTKYKVRGKHIILKIDERNNRPTKVNTTAILLKPNQGPVIVGTVTDKQGTPLPGASILEKGTTNGTQSDFDGNFTLEVAGSDAVLVISYIGFEPQEIIVGNQTSISVALNESAASLEEVVVVGYGTQKKQDVTGSISSVGGDVINEVPSASVEQSLSGRMAGLQVISGSGAPGSGATIRVRGVGTLNNNEPLYVIDGIIL